MALITLFEKSVLKSNLTETCFVFCSSTIGIILERFVEYNGYWRKNNFIVDFEWIVRELQHWCPIIICKLL